VGAYTLDLWLRMPLERLQQLEILPKPISPASRLARRPVASVPAGRRSR